MSPRESRATTVWKVVWWIDFHMVAAAYSAAGRGRNARAAAIPNKVSRAEVCQTCFAGSLDVFGKNVPVEDMNSHK